MIERAADGSVRIALKVVPGAKRDEIAGPLGDRLKVRVAAPPEDGKANKAVCAVIAAALGIKPKSVSVVVGLASPEKVVRVEVIDVYEVRRKLGIDGHEA